MDSHVYVDSEGNIIQAVSSSIPGLTIIPNGLTAGDAQSITQEEFDRLNTELSNTAPQTRGLQAQIDALTATVETLTSLTKSTPSSHT